MHPSKRAKTLTATVGAKHTPQELQQIQESAKALGLTISGWARRAHLEVLKTNSDTRLILAEVLGLRRIFLSLQVDFAHGQESSPDRLRAAMEEAERAKFEMADKRIAAFRDPQNKPPPVSNTESNS